VVTYQRRTQKPRLWLLQDALHRAFARGVARGKAKANLKRNMPALVERISKEFLEGEQEIQRNSLRMGIESWSVDEGERRRKRLEAVVERVAKAYRAVGIY
jgi:hypothetical protein